MGRFFGRLAPLLAIVVVSVLATLAFPGCSGKAVDQADPAGLMQEAEEDVKSDHYQLALDKLRQIKNKFPYSKYSLDAQLRIADVYFLQESYPEAAASYESFADLHPKHEKVPYALFRVGKSHYNDVPDPIARDMTPAQKSIDAYSDFLRRFPQAQEAAEAKSDSARLRKLLSEKELYVANFYYKRDAFRAAKPRFQKVISSFPETDSAKEANQRLVGIDEKIKKEIEQENAATRSALTGK